MLVDVVEFLEPVEGTGRWVGIMSHVRLDPLDELLGVVAEPSGNPRMFDPPLGGVLLPRPDWEKRVVAWAAGHAPREPIQRSPGEVGHRADPERDLVGDPLDPFLDAYDVLRGVRVRFRDGRHSLVLKECLAGIVESIQLTLRPLEPGQ